jgi:hypothetical protein
LSFGYGIEGYDPPWRPIRAFDDGTQVFVEFPATLREWKEANYDRLVRSAFHKNLQCAVRLPGSYSAVVVLPADLQD